MTYVLSEWLDPKLWDQYKEPEMKEKDRMLQFFHYEHLSEHLAEASKPFCDLANWVALKYPSNPERTVCLRKLLEAKDAAVRTLLYVDENTPVEKKRIVVSNPDQSNPD